MRCSMDIVYILFSFALAVFNLFRALNGLNAMNFIFSILWLGIGVVLAVRYWKKNRHNKED